MTQKVFNDVYNTLELYETRYEMIKEVKRVVEINPTYLSSIPDDNEEEMTAGYASSILSRLGFPKESLKLLQVARAGDEITDLYVSKSRDGRGMPELFQGASPLPPLYSRDVKEPSSAEIEETIDDMKKLTVHLMKKIDEMLCNAKPQPYFAKFITVVKAIYMYYP